MFFLSIWNYNYRYCYNEKSAQRDKHCVGTGCSKVRTPPARPLHTHRQDQLQYTALQLASTQCNYYCHFCLIVPLFQQSFQAVHDNNFTKNRFHSYKCKTLKQRKCTKIKHQLTRERCRWHMWSRTIIFFSLHQAKNRNQWCVILSSTKQLFIPILPSTSANGIVLQ